jgi:anthranilate phosphoribosyltransferase
LTVAGESQVVETIAGALREFTLVPEDAGLPRAPVEAIRGGDPAQNAAQLLALFEGARGPYRDTVVLNAAAALVIAGKAHDLRAAARMAADALDTGAAAQALERLRRAASPDEIQDSAPIRH